MYIDAQSESTESSCILNPLAHARIQCYIMCDITFRLLDAEKLTTSYWSMLSSCVLSCTLLVLQLMHVHDTPLLSTSSALLHFACLWPLVGCVLYTVVTDLSSVKPSYFKVNQFLVIRL